MICSRLRTHLVGDGLHRVHRGAVYVGLAGFLQPPVGHRSALTLQRALERGGAAVHGGGLHRLGSK